MRAPLACAAALLALAGCAGEDAVPATERVASYAQDGALPAAAGRAVLSNVVVLCLGGVGADALFGGDASPESSTGGLERSAAVFTQATATSGRSESAFISLLTGKYPRNHGV